MSDPESKAQTSQEKEVTSKKPKFEVQVILLKRKLEAAAREVHSILLQGRQASKDANQVNRFKAMYKCVEKYYQRYECIYEDLNEMHLLEGKSEFPSKEEVTNFDTVRRYYYEAHTLFEGINSPVIQVANSQGKSSSGPQETTIRLDTNLPSSTHLPKIAIPEFNGELSQWPRFRDSFQSIIHDDASIPAMTKFHYLVTSLGKSAAAVINHLPLIADNYDVAWQALITTFDNKRILAATYMNAILDSTPMTNTPTYKVLTEFLSKVTENISAFRLLNIPNEADFILYYLTFRCLDKRMREQFEIRYRDSPFPTFENLTSFIREHCRALQLADFSSLRLDTPSRFQNDTISNRSIFNKPKSKASLFTKSASPHTKSKQSTGKACHICTKDHKIVDCPTFISANSDQRRRMLTGYTGCYNCLSPYHFVRNCTSSRVCKFCQRKHHSMIHTSYPVTANSGKQLTKIKPPQLENVPTTSNVCMNSVNLEPKGVLLGTTLVQIADRFNSHHTARAVVDCGSQHSFMTSRLMKSLNLPIFNFKHKLVGIGQTPLTHIKGKSRCTITPPNRNHITLTFEALVVDNITSNLPNISLSSGWIEPYLSYELADPSFWQQKEVDLLLGADVFADILSGESVRVTSTGPLLISSIFGYIVMGSVPNEDSGVRSHSSTCMLIQNTKYLTHQLDRFWDIEENLDVGHSSSQEDEIMEKHFVDTFSRADDGRYILRLPFKGARPTFENSSAIAMKRFRNMEMKLQRNSALSNQYTAFMEEYLQLKHMSVTTSPSKYMLPHHSVMKNGKIRVVFDASASSHEGSLNGSLIVGPKLQRDIRTIIFNFRFHEVALVADIIKMYRQILIHPEDRCFQHIYWRSNPTSAVMKYELNTLTYGTSCAPFQAQRVLKQLAEDEGMDYPLAVKVLERDMFMDDLVTGAASLDEAVELQQQLVALFEKGGFQLDKWASNHRALILRSSEKIKPVSLNLEEDNTVKILGLQWNSETDTFGYKIVTPQVPETKRGLLSAIARIYDPLGWLAPTVVLAKGFIQELWKANVGWDDEIPEAVKAPWQSFIQNLTELTKIVIPRRVLAGEAEVFQIIGFCDASNKAYSATLYLRICSPKIETYLLTARTRLAPLKTLSVPRLELCGALLLIRTYEFIKESLNLIPMQMLEPLFFTDSQIVLAWLKTSPHDLKTFVANRVSEITSSAPANLWSHVGSKDNPSDISSRGLTPRQLVNCTQWWKGPDWLALERKKWPCDINITFELDIPELKTCSQLRVLHTVDAEDNLLITWMERFSNYLTIIRIVGWIHRFRLNCKTKDKSRFGPLSLFEVNLGLTTCIKAVQSHFFFQRKEPRNSLIPKSLLSLTPFLDDQNILRVGGRLSRSNLPSHMKHPILLPGDTHFTRILVDHYHRSYLHPGPSLLQALIQRKYWIPSLRRITRRRTFLCLKCYKSKAASYSYKPIMADLPESRVRGVRAFLKCGVDFAGPFQLRNSLLRKAVITKMYLCLFVCMATKAVHLEAVTDLSTAAFLACFARFTARRGYPVQVFSDCGTNFVGAASHLRDIGKWFQSEDTKKAIIDYSTNAGFTWKFNAPYGPHQGGLWESAIKSAKSIVKKLIGDTPLTIEEWFTISSKVESILNSRPLCQLSSSPEENDFLTPGHFLIGDHITTPPELSLEDVPMNRLKRWELVQRISQDFWRRWSLEYLSTLQARAKWKENMKNVGLGELVIVRDDHTPPLQWPTGRVCEVLPGRDGVVRVVKLKVGNSEFLRPVQKLVPLKPLQEPPFSDSIKEF